SIATSVRAEKNEADAEFLTKVVPAIAASNKILDYSKKHVSDKKVKDFAGRVLKQHTGSLKTATGHAKRLKVPVDANGDAGSKEMIDQLSKLKGTAVDVAFLEWLSNIHHDASLFENEVKNGADPALKAYAKGSIDSGNDHLKEAQENLARLKK